MQNMVYVGSKQRVEVIVAVPGTGMTPNDVRRNAIQVARSLHRITDPIALGEHEAAVRLRRQQSERYKMPVERSVPFYRLPETRQIDWNAVK